MTLVSIVIFVISETLAVRAKILTFFAIGTSIGPIAVASASCDNSLYEILAEFKSGKIKISAGPSNSSIKND